VRQLDLAGQKFGKLTAVKPTGRNRSGQVLWEAECECGNVCTAVGSDLARGKKKSCGCGAKNIPQNFTGKRFGKLLVLRKDEANNRRYSKWICQCDCGTVKSVAGCNLVSGGTTSCGCSLGKALELDGKRFGRLTVISKEGVVNDRSVWKCLCDCGSEVSVIGSLLLRGSTNSCGCYRTDRTKEANTKHGQSMTKLYQRWAGMIKRCTLITHRSYSSYGGRGIKVCDRWMSFENFLADMGHPPDNSLTIERIDNDGDYEPSNCRWATKAEQNSNKRPRKDLRIRADGKLVKIGGPNDTAE
jgi:hypothetical protein